MEQMEGSWRKHLEEDNGQGGYRIRGTDVHADDVLRWIAAGASVDEIVAKSPPLTRADVVACLDCAQEAIEKQRVIDAVRTGAAQIDAGQGIPHETVLEHLNRKFGLPLP